MTTHAFTFTPPGAAPISIPLEVLPDDLFAITADGEDQGLHAIQAAILDGLRNASHNPGARLFLTLLLDLTGEHSTALRECAHLKRDLADARQQIREMGDEVREGCTRDAQQIEAIDHLHDSLNRAQTERDTYQAQIAHIDQAHAAAAGVFACMAVEADEVAS